MATQTKGRFEYNTGFSSQSLQETLQKRRKHFTSTKRRKPFRYAWHNPFYANIPLKAMPERDASA
ncbi:hypothetical protein [Enorma massiliensis]|uniref:hypothetical protein n=1 Tax=Enorma massiliensis TaxID=1472761 RepID=UPI003AF06565